ncbi:LysR family transcriptional regulator [Halalkalibacter oceani]|uniref:LysR family transcriptional regulator n=1 Tax=Halalkalibacter oceani TaxID=1653776 RepID=A0A9X2INH6_9BACI|nr:LysR family transcriptional regulator [Halalkalibacter oceani]
MRDQDWQIIKVLFQTKNITKAANQLFISQPALTNRIQQIEKEFGVQLIHRGRRGVHFTSEGEYLAKTADEMLLKIRLIKEDVKNIGKDVTGTLRIAVSHIFTRYKLPRLLKLFHNLYPDVEFQVIAGRSKDVFQLVSNNDVHIGFVRGDYTWHESKHLLFEETICVASQRNISMENLPSLARVNYQTEPLLKTTIDNWWRENYSQPPLIGMEVDKVDTCKEMVIHGLGYGIFPSAILDDRQDLYKMDLLDKDGKPVIRKTWMIVKDDTLQLNIVNAFVEFVAELDVRHL